MVVNCFENVSLRRMRVRRIEVVLVFDGLIKNHKFILGAVYKINMLRYSTVYPRLVLITMFTTTTTWW